MDILQKQARIADVLQHIGKDDKIEPLVGVFQARNVADDDFATITEALSRDSGRMGGIFDPCDRQTALGRLKEKFAMAASDLEQITCERAAGIGFDSFQIISGGVRFELGYMIMLPGLIAHDK